MLLLLNAVKRSKSDNGFEIFFILFENGRKSAEIWRGFFIFE